MNFDKQDNIQEPNNDILPNGIECKPARCFDEIMSDCYKIQQFFTDKDCLKFSAILNPILSKDLTTKIPETECNSTPDYAEVMFKGFRKSMYKNSARLALNLFDYIIVEIENGIDIGFITSFGEIANKKQVTQYESAEPKYSLVREATREDMERFHTNSIEEATVVERTRGFVEQYKLDMKITECEWQFDRQRLTIYFTAPQRIDFRELVKELARAFKTRIELRQISSREETKRIGSGIGCCGLSLCCTSFLKDFSHVTLEHARTQQLSSNVAKLSGYCGRLKCCLLFEYDTYVTAFEKYPPLNSQVETADGLQKIMKVDIFKDIIYLCNITASKYNTITFNQLSDYVRSGKVYLPDKEDQQPLVDFVSDDLELLED